MYYTATPNMSHDINYSRIFWRNACVTTILKTNKIKQTIMLDSTYVINTIHALLNEL